MNYNKQILARPYPCHPFIVEVSRLIIGFGLNRKLIFTENYIGLGPIDTKIGHAVYSIIGAGSPFVSANWAASLWSWGNA